MILFLELRDEDGRMLFNTQGEKENFNGCKLVKTEHWGWVFEGALKRRKAQLEEGDSSQAGGRQGG